MVKKTCYIIYINNCCWFNHHFCSENHHSCHPRRNLRCTLPTCAASSVAQSSRFCCSVPAACGAMFGFRGNLTDFTMGFFLPKLELKPARFREGFDRPHVHEEIGLKSSTWKIIPQKIPCLVNVTKKLWKITIFNG